MWNNWYAMQIMAKDRHQEMMEEARMERMRNEMVAAESKKQSPKEREHVPFRLVKAGQPVH